MKIYLDSIGCRLNQAEIELYARQLRKSGHELVPTLGDADMAVINTCTVTTAADADSRKMIRNAVRTGVDEVVITGCWVTMNPDEAESIVGVSKVVNNRVKDRLVREVITDRQLAHDLEPLQREIVPGKRFRTRAFVKVQDGCNNRCTFCITTHARGSGRSVSIRDVLRDVQSLMRTGSNGNYNEVQEIVLTGVHMGSWGNDLAGNLKLKDLVIALLDETDIPRIRLSSLEPWDIEGDFFDLWDNPRMCRHLHLPLQSGCETTLRRMARKTNTEDFTKLVRSARRRIPDLAITTDIIAGFPGETDEEFKLSIEFVRAMEFSGGHVFSYSGRPGTVSVSYPDQVPFHIRKERNSLMRNVLAESRRNFQKKYIGKEMSVLWEKCTRNPDRTWNMSGLTDNYIRVSIRADVNIWNRISKVRLLHSEADSFVGEFSE